MIKTKDYTYGLRLEYLKSVLDYNPETGEFHWKVKVNQKTKIGQKAGYIEKTTGYVRIVVKRHRYRAHRLAWFYMTGKWPKDKIDHEDRNRSNNTFTNLRECNDIQNHGNYSKRKNNISGYKGVHFDKKMQMYRSCIKKIHLGYFKTALEGSLVYDAKAKELYGEFASK